MATVQEMAARITAMCADSSPTARAIEQVERSKTFIATILGGTREKSSTRVLVRLRTRPSQYHPDGIEPARTERTDTPTGAAMANRLRSLVDHRVALWVEEESFTDRDGKVKKSRVIRHVEDLGVDESSQGPPALTVAAQ